MKTNVIITLAIEGMHNWPEARNVFPEVGFLSDMHRHVFHFTLKKRVRHDNRDVEFIMFKRDVEQYLRVKYWRADYRCLMFGPMSCEMIAKELLEYFECEYVAVWEDNENGAEVYL
jgi:hypothetical protein